MLDARLSFNAPQERENKDSELTKQFYNSSDRPSQEGKETNQQTEANSMNDVHQLEKQFKSSSDYPSQKTNLLVDPTNRSIEANSNTSFNLRLWIHPRINYLQMIKTNGTTSTESLDQQHYSSADHPTLVRKCNRKTRIEESSHYDYETYQSQLEWKIQRWLRTNEWNQSYPPCQIEEISCA